MLSFERCAEIARTGHAGHEQLMRGSRHDLRSEDVSRISLVPMRIVAVPKEHGVNVQSQSPGSTSMPSVEITSASFGTVEAYQPGRSQ